MRNLLFVLLGLGILGILFAVIAAVSRANEKAMYAYAKEFNLTVAGVPDQRMINIGPFHYCGKGQQVWNLPVQEGMLWVRFGFSDDVYLVDLHQQEHQLH